MPKLEIKNIFTVQIHASPFAELQNSSIYNWLLPY